MLVKWEAFLGGGLKGDNPPCLFTPSFIPIVSFWYNTFPFVATLLHFYLYMNDNRKHITDYSCIVSDRYIRKLLIVSYKYIDPIFGFRFAKDDPTPFQKIVCSLVA